MGIGFKVDSLSKRFGPKKALDRVSCAFEAGRISAVIGPNGSGKTTLLKILARLDSPDEGAVSYLRDGRTLPEDASLMRSMTLVGQRPTLFRMSVIGNVAYGLKARGLAPDEVNIRAGEALKAGGMAELARERAWTLSAGQAQRAALIRAYALKPEAVLMDEPTANLDPEGAAFAEGLITGMCRDSGTTVILVTHNLFQARRLADRVFFLMGGRLVEQGDAPAVFSSPADPLTGRYVSGEMVC